MSRSNPIAGRRGDAVGPIVPAGTPAWITVEFIELPIRVWQPYYQAQLPPDEAVTMILGVGRLYEVLGQQARAGTRGAQRSELQRQASLLVAQQDRLLNLRIENQIDEKTFVRKQTELRDRLASIKLQLDAVDRSHDENAELAAKVFELSQTLRQQWLTADYGNFSITAWFM